MAARARAVGRPRDEVIDTAILDSARALLAEGGMEALTVVAVAERAGTTRPAVYRRYGSLVELALAAIAAGGGAADEPPTTGDAFADLVAELTALHDGARAVDGLGLVATVLGPGTDDAVKAVYRERVVAPRRARLTAILERAVAADALPASTANERALVVAMAVGSRYALALAGEPAADDWPDRTARLVWRALGGLDPAG